jgi:phosphatidylglycerol:prolipoprotein diacylglycerol transferase
MLQYPEIDPILFSLGPYDVRLGEAVYHLGPFQVHWYGTMYLVGFALAWLLGLARARQAGSGWTGEELEGLIFNCAIALIVGARVGYMVFYQTAALIEHPLALFQIWHGGMSFHGGAIGICIALLLFCRRRGKTFLEVADFLVPLAPPGLCAGRLGNFINGELWGRVTDVPWGMVFPTGGPEPRHPSQLYEAGLEGVVLFFVLWAYTRQPRPRGAALGLFLCLYGLFRSFVEFFREPDQQLGYLAFDWLTMGQILSLPMVAIGLGLMIHAHRAQRAG